MVTSHGHCGIVDGDIGPLVEVLRSAWNEGSPVAGQKDSARKRAARYALRRWRSFERRHPEHRADFERRIEDLAKGLCNQFERDPKLAGPLLEDYRFLARRLASLLVCSETRAEAKAT